MAKGSNIDYRKWEKKNLILHIIRNNPDSSRSSVKTASRLSMESVLQYINELLQENLIYEAGNAEAPASQESGTAGRKATILKINPSGCYFIGVKFNANAIIGVVMDFAENTVVTKRICLKQGVRAENVIRMIFDCIDGMMTELGDKRELVRGIGIGVPGFVNSDEGISIRYVHIEGWEDIHLKDLVEGRYGIPVYIEQSIKVTAIALKTKPENLKVREMLYILLGRGVGMVIISGNRICSGHTSCAGEIGHIFAADNGIKCECGKYGCLETVASSNAVQKKLLKGFEQGLFPEIRKYVAERGRKDRMPSVADLVRAAEVGEADSLKLVSEITPHISRAVSAAVTLLNPSKVIFSGEVSLIPKLADNIAGEIKERCLAESTKSLVFEISRHDDVFDAIGAAKLVWLYQFNTGTGVFEERHGAKAYLKHLPVLKQEL